MKSLVTYYFIAGLVATTTFVAAGVCPHVYGGTAPKCVEPKQPRKEDWWAKLDWWPAASPGTFDQYYIQPCPKDAEQFNCIADYDVKLSPQKCIDLRTNTPCTTVEPSSRDWWSLNETWPDAYAESKTLTVCTTGYVCTNNKCLDADGKSACTIYDPGRNVINPFDAQRPKIEAMPNITETYNNQGGEIKYPGVYYLAEGDLVSTAQMLPTDLIKGLRENCTRNQCQTSRHDGRGSYCFDTEYPLFDSDPRPWKACVKLNGYNFVTSQADRDVGNDDPFWHATWDVLQNLMDKSTAIEKKWVFAQRTTYGYDEHKEVSLYGVPRNIEYSVKTPGESNVYVNLEFNAYEVLKGCGVIDQIKGVTDKISGAASAVGYGPLAPLQPFAVGISLPFKFASFLAGCETIKPTGWEPVNSAFSNDGEIRTAKRAWSSWNRTVDVALE